MKHPLIVAIAAAWVMLLSIFAAMNWVLVREHSWFALVILNIVLATWIFGYIRPWRKRQP